MEIIPAINCIDLECVEDKISTLKRFLPQGTWVHLDVADARFTFNRTWGDPTLWVKFWRDFNLEVHLMVEEPEKHAPEWIKAGARRIIVHAEALTSETASEIAALARKRGAEVILASNPETPAENLKPYFKIFHSFQVLSVNPGFAGQQFLPTSLEKIKFLRKHLPDATIEVDGGINDLTAKQAKAAGADILVAASYIFDAEDSKKAYESLQRV